MTHKNRPGAAMWQLRREHLCDLCNITMTTFFSLRVENKKLAGSNHRLVPPELRNSTGHWSAVCKKSVFFSLSRSGGHHRKCYLFINQMAVYHAALEMINNVFNSTAENIQEKIILPENPFYEMRSRNKGEVRVPPPKTCLG